MSSRAATAPVFGSIRAHWTWSRRNPPPKANHRPFGSTASRGPVPGAFHWAFHSFFPAGTSQAVIPVFSDVLYRTVASGANTTRCTWSPHLASELSPRGMSRTTLPVERSNSRTSCPVRPPASHLPSAD